MPKARATSHTRPLLKVPSSVGSEQRAQEQANLTNERRGWGALTNHRQVLLPLPKLTLRFSKLITHLALIINGLGLSCPMRALDCRDQPIRAQKGLTPWQHTSPGIMSYVTLFKLPKKLSSFSTSLNHYVIYEGLEIETCMPWDLWKMLSSSFQSLNSLKSLKCFIHKLR